MKIAFIVSSYPTLTETFIQNQIEGLLDLGHEVEVFCDSINEERIGNDDAIDYYLSHCVHSFNMPRKKHIRIFKAIPLLITNFHKDPIKIIKSLNIFSYGKSALSLKRFYYLIPFLNTNHDIIHCHFGPNGLIGILLKEMGVKGRVITTFYGYDMSGHPKYEKRRIAYTKLFNKGSFFLVEGNNMKKELINLGCPNNKIKIQRIPIHVNKYEFHERKLRTKDEKVVILHCGRFVEKKGLIYALKAVKNVVERFQSLEFRIIGDGPLKAEIENFIKTKKLDEYVVLLGYQPHHIFLEEVQKAHILLQPSVTAENGDSEGGAPTVLIEAQASGLPIISTYHADIPGVVIDGKSGFLAPERDVDALTEKLEYLIKHPEIWPEMGKAGRAFVEEKHNSEKLIRQLEGIYYNVL